MKRPTPKYKCPHCGWEFPATRLKNGLVPGHDLNAFSCPGSQQSPRCAASDKRPLWKDEAGDKADEEDGE